MNKMTNQDIKIREYNDSNYNRLLELNTEFSDFFEEFDVFQKLDQDTEAVAKYYLDKTLNLVKSNGGVIYVAEVENKVIALAGLYLRDQSEEEALTTIPMKLGHLESLFVSNKYRNNGIGEKLIQKAEDYFKSKKCTHSELDVFGPNTKAHNFYTRQGYMDIKISMIKTL